MPSSPVHYHEGQFPPKKIDWEPLIPLLGPASAALARYDGTLAAVPNAAVLLSPLMTQEAVLSSRIEGTQATMGEVLEYEAGAAPKDADPRQTADIQEVLNYRKAMWRAVELLNDLPLCQRVLKEAHQELMDGVRGRGKAPGDYRQILKTLRENHFFSTLRETKGRQAAVLVFRALLNIAEGRQVF